MKIFRLKQKRTIRNISLVVLSRVVGLLKARQRGRTDCHTLCVSSWTGAFQVRIDGQFNRLRPAADLGQLSVNLRVSGNLGVPLNVELFLKLGWYRKQLKLWSRRWFMSICWVLPMWQKLFLLMTVPFVTMYSISLRQPYPILEPRSPSKASEFKFKMFWTIFHTAKWS